jgi:membrane-bound lytic murein transglycosylase D
MQNKYYLILILLILMTFRLWAAEQSEEAGTGEEEAPVVLEEISGQRNLTGSRPWRAPQFQNQENALGWSPTAFAVPDGLKANYQFWLEIYTKYTTDQGILHDSENIDLIYEILDFTHISSRADLTDGHKQRQKTLAVKEGKKRIVVLLKKLEQVTDPKDLTAEEKRIWDYFQKIEGKKKFTEATKKNRLRFQLGQRDRMIQGIFFSGRYLEDFEKTFREAGIPIELTRLPFVESSYNVLARSKVGASGLWQIMRYTGRPYMMINNSVDKRNFPADATRLAAKLMRMNYGMLESWPLALTGYNHGPAGVMRLTKIHQSRELVDLGKEDGKKKRLGFASRNFYPSFLAALEAEQNAPKYFGNVLWSQSLNDVEIQLTTSIKWSDVLKWFDGNDQIAQIYNPHITANARKFGRPIPAKAFISVPLAKKEIVLAALDEKMKSPKTKDRETAMASSASEKAGQELRSYEVISGDSLYSIAREYGVTVKELLNLNDLEAPDKLKVGQKLKIP